MKKNFGCIQRRILLFVFAVALVISMAACGDSQGEQEGSDWVYVPEFFSGEGLEEVSWYNAKIVGDDLYYTSYDWDEETMTSSTSLKRYSILDGSTGEMPLNLPEGANLNGWAIGEDGCLYAALSVWNWDENTGSSSSTKMVAKYDTQGNEVFLYDFTAIADKDSENNYIDGIVVDGQGRSYVVASSVMWLFDAEGNPAGTVNMNSGMSSWLNGYILGQDGKVYVAVTTYDGNGSSTALSAVNFETKSLEDSRTGFVTNSTMAQDTEGRFLISNDTAVSVYDPETEETEKLFDWVDCDINGSYVQGFGVLSDGRIVAAYQDWSNDDSGMALLTRTSADQVVQKEQIILAVMYNDSDLAGAVVSFNKSSDKYHVSIRNYMDENSTDDYLTRYNDALNRLNSDITSNNCPDILSLSGMNIQQLAAKGVFEDLSPYLDKSSRMERSNLLDNILDAFTYDGVLVSIPDSFTLDTIIGRASDVGEEMGWTLEEMIALADAHPEAELFNRMSKGNIMGYCLTYNMDTFVDWETGSCNFDSDEFKSLLEFVNRFPDSINYDSDQMSEPERIQAGQVLLTDAYISELDAIQLYIEMFGGDVTCIGYPNTDKSSGCILSPNGAYAIMARSKEKEGAWAFIESYLTRENVRYRWGFPNNRSELQAMAEEAVKVEYLTDENGEYVLDENGDRIPMGGSHGIGWGNWFYDYRIPTQEEVDVILDLIEVAQLGSATNDQIMSILQEEAEAFFQGQKPVDEVARIIQSRVGNYVSENS